MTSQAYIMLIIPFRTIHKQFTAFLTLIVLLDLAMTEAISSPFFTYKMVNGHFIQIKLLRAAKMYCLMPHFRCPL